MKDKNKDFRSAETLAEFTSRYLEMVNSANKKTLVDDLAEAYVTISEQEKKIKKLESDLKVARLMSHIYYVKTYKYDGRPAIDESEAVLDNIILTEENLKLKKQNSDLRDQIESYQLYHKLP